LPEETVGNGFQRSFSPSSLADLKVIAYLSLQAVEGCARLQPHKVQEGSDRDIPQANHRWVSWSARQWGQQWRWWQRYKLLVTSKPRHKYWNC